MFHIILHILIKFLVLSYFIYLLQKQPKRLNNQLIQEISHNERIDSLPKSVKVSYYCCQLLLRIDQQNLQNATLTEKKAMFSGPHQRPSGFKPAEKMI